MAALTSLETTSPHFGQIHSLSDRVRFLFMCPQFACSLDDGANLPIFRMFLPYHSALYSNIDTKVDHPASLIDCASLWFFTILETAKSSIATDWLSLISCVEVLCKKSFLWLATFSWSIANLCFVLFPLCFEYFRCVYFNLLCALRRNFGLSNSFPSDETRYVLIPKSIPTVVFSLIFAFGLIASPVSQSIETKYFPVGVLLIVACFISPLIGRCKTISIPFLNFGIINLPFSKVTFCGTLKLPLFNFFLKFGKLFCLLKKAVYALSKLVMDCCNDWLFISLSHSHSVLRSFSWLCKAKQLKLTLLPAQAICLHSKARLYTKRLAPICLFSRMDCSFVGLILYLKALSINYKYVQIYKSLKKQQNLFKIIINFVLGRFHPTHAKRWDGL